MALFTDEEQQRIVHEAEQMEIGIKVKHSMARISTNGALEVFFKLALFVDCMENRKGNQNG